MPTPNETSPSEQALEALANFIDQLDIPETTDENLAQEDKEFPPALVNGKALHEATQVATKVAD